MRGEGREMRAIEMIEESTHLILSLSSTSLQHQLLEANGNLHVTRFPCITWTVREDHSVIPSQRPSQV